MGVGAFFILLLLVIVLALVGAAVYAIASKLRRDQLSPEGDKVEGPPKGEDPAAPEPQGTRPVHRRVTNEQNAEFVHDR